MNLNPEQKLTYRHRKQSFLWLQSGEEGGMNQEFRINRCTLLYIKQIPNKALLYIQNYTQHFVTTYKGKESEKEYILYTY